MTYFLLLRCLFFSSYFFPLFINFKFHFIEKNNNIIIFASFHNFIIYNEENYLNIISLFIANINVFNWIYIILFNNILENLHISLKNIWNIFVRKFKRIKFKNDNKGILLEYDFMKMFMEIYS